MIIDEIRLFRYRSVEALLEDVKHVVGDERCVHFDYVGDSTIERVKCVKSRMTKTARVVGKEEKTTRRVGGSGHLCICLTGVVAFHRQACSLSCFCFVSLVFILSTSFWLLSDVAFCSALF
jgi:hypothetical protein